MSGIVKIDKDGLTNNASTLESVSTSLITTIQSLHETLNSVPSHSHFSNLTSKANTIASSLDAVGSDIKNVSSTIQAYIESIVLIDGENITDISSTLTDAQKAIKDSNTNSWTSISSSNSYYGGTSSVGTYTYSYSSGPSGTTVYTDTSWGTVDTSNAFPGKEYNYEGIEEYVDAIAGTAVTLPAGLGNVHSYMGWQCITATSSTQYKLREVAGMNFDSEGFAKIGDRYVVATTTTFGKVGDYIDVYQEDGTVIKCVIGDIKNQNDAGCNQWGHDNGHCVVEFVVDKSSWYGTNKTVNGLHPEFNKNITKIVNKGNYFDFIQTDAAKISKEEDTTDSSSTTQ